MPENSVKLSAILLNYRRPYHLPEIVRHLNRFDCIDDILIWNNAPERLPAIRNASIFQSSENLYTLGRFEACKYADNELVLVQDDDVLVNNVPELLDEFQKRRDFSLTGRHTDGTTSVITTEERIVANLGEDNSSKHWSWWQAMRPQWCELGFGTIFSREWAKTLDDWPYDRELLKRKADKIFSVIHPWQAVRAGENEITRLQHNGKESGRDSHALSKLPDHKKLNAEAARLAAEWKRRS